MAGVIVEKIMLRGTHVYDFIIIGGGILGLSTAMQLIRAYPDRKMLLVEKEDGPARHQTGHNSGVIHAGVYYTPGSLKARFCLEGNRATKAFCDEHGIVLIADEVQCGMGRTGRLFALEHSNVVADMVTTAKSLAAGMPLGAVTGRAEIMDSAHPGGLGGTYSGNPLACAAALKALDIITEPEFLAGATRLGDQIRERLLKIQERFPDLVGDVCGVGPMLAMEIVKDASSREPCMESTAAITAETLSRGVITIRAGLYSNCVRFLPALDMPADHLAEALDVVEAAVEAVASSRGGR